MPSKKTRGDKPSVAKAAKAKAATAPPKILSKVAGKKKPTTKKPKKVVAKKRAPKKGIKATVGKSADIFVDGAKRGKTGQDAGRRSKAGDGQKGREISVQASVLSVPPESSATTVPVTLKSNLTRRDYLRAGAFVMLIVSLLVGGYAMKAIAAEFVGPTLPAPGGNIPVTIWNRQSSGIKQENAEIDIDGQTQFGDSDLELGDDGVPRNLVYGVARLTLDGAYTMGSEDNLLLLQTVAVTGGVPAYTTRFYVNRVGGMYSNSTVTGASGIISSATSRILDAANTGQYVYYGAARYDASVPANLRSHPKGDYLLWLQTRDVTAAVTSDRFSVNVSGDVYASGCFGATFVGRTALNYAPGDVSGYYGANNKCKIDYPSYPGVHVCTSEEMLESIECSVAGDPIRGVTDGAVAWINGGPPGFTANSNDCMGWTSSASSAYGRYWIFNLASGGRGTTTSCNSPGIPFACCR